MSALEYIKTALRTVVYPLPPGARWALHGSFAAVTGESTDSMRRKHPDTRMLAGLGDLIVFLKAEGVGGKAVEVGSYAGESAEFFARHFSQLTAVDPWTFLWRTERAFDERMKRHPNIKKLKMKGCEAAPLFPDGTLDFVYIDADHRYASVRGDISLWLPKVRKGGMIAGHDYAAREPGVLRAVHELLGKPDRVFRDTSWVKRVLT